MPIAASADVVIMYMSYALSVMKVVNGVTNRQLCMRKNKEKLLCVTHKNQLRGRCWSKLTFPQLSVFDVF